jgi:hypothetical protein
LGSYAGVIRSRFGDNLEPITLAVVVVAKVNPMTIENDALREDLRASIKLPVVELPDYSTDLLVQRRVGGILADVCEKEWLVRKRIG